jgi:putative pyoverdin transport system ATP-binding/permease protein
MNEPCSQTHRGSDLVRESLRLLRPFWPMAVFATLMGTLSGLATAWLLATINTALYSNGKLAAGLLTTFVGLVVLTLAGEIISDLGNSWIGQQIIASLRKELVAKIIRAPIDQIERYKPHRLLAILSQDVDTISAFSYGFSAIAIAAAITLGCILYLLFLSPTLFLIVATVIAIGVSLNTVARSYGERAYEQARGAQDDLYQYYRSITEGAKELRINRKRRTRVQGERLGGTIDRIRDTKIAVFRIFMSANAVDSALFFALIGIIVAWQDRFRIEQRTVSGFVLVLLYLKGPLEQVINAYGAFINAQVSFKRIAQFSADSIHHAPDVIDVGAVDPTSHGTWPGAVDTLELCNVVYTFPATEDAATFVFGPVDLVINCGEILFIVGENGCGKTTLIKLISGLYQPQQGKVLLNGQPVTAATRDNYRQLFSAVFFDYFLFDDLDAPPATTHETMRSYLTKLELAHKVAIVDGAFSTTELSAGQRKRLALIQVYLEGRPVIIFDEWAAEQDPTFRRIFYEDLLPDLKRQGKTLIVISHDDRYFGAADRTIRLAAGKIADITQAETPAHA